MPSFRVACDFCVLHGVGRWMVRRNTVGVTSHAGNRGLFFSLDVLELTKDKKLMGGKYDAAIQRFLQ